jgi:integrase-like protein
MQRPHTYYSGHYPLQYIFVPRNLESEVIQAHHDGLENGHPGISRVMEKIQRSFYFAGMYRKIKKYVSACDSCNRNKYTHQKPFGKMTIEEYRATKPWEFITADFVEMPTTKHALYKNIINALLVIVDTFSKFTILLPSRKETTGPQQKRYTTSYGKECSPCLASLGKCYPIEIRSLRL